MPQASPLHVAAPRSAATHVRSTLLQASLRSVRNYGNFQRWEAYIDPTARDFILDAIAPGWVPIEIGLAHYTACDRFDIEDEELEKIGEGVGTQLQSTLLGVASKMALASVLSNEVIHQCFLKLWPRLFQGGALSIAFTGKQVTIELRGAVLTRSRYFRGTMLGNVRAGSRLFGQKLSFLRAASYDEANDHYVVQLGHE